MSAENRVIAPASRHSLVTATLLTVSLVAPLIVWLVLEENGQRASPVLLIFAAGSQILLAAIERRIQNRYVWRDSRAASVLYYLQLERQLFRAGVVVAVVAVASCAAAVESVRFASSEFALLATIPGALFALSILRLRALRTSVDSGTFGTRRAEAQALINFMLRNAHHFKRDGGGTPLVNDGCQKPTIQRVSPVSARARSKVAM